MRGNRSNTAAFSGRYPCRASNAASLARVEGQQDIYTSFCAPLPAISSITFADIPLRGGSVRITSGVPKVLRHIRIPSDESAQTKRVLPVSRPAAFFFAFSTASGTISIPKSLSVSSVTHRPTVPAPQYRSQTVLPGAMPANSLALYSSISAAAVLTCQKDRGDMRNSLPHRVSVRYSFPLMCTHSRPSIRLLLSRLIFTKKEVTSGFLLLSSAAIS